MTEMLVSPAQESSDQRRNSSVAPTGAHGAQTADTKLIDDDWELMYWAKGSEKLTEALVSYWTSTGLMAALTGSIAFSSAITPLESVEYLRPEESSLHWDEQTAFLMACSFYAAMYSSFVCAFLSLIVITAFYNQFLFITANDDSVLWFVKKWPVGLPDTLFTVSLVLFLIAAIFPLLVALPAHYGIVILSMLSTLALMIFTFVVRFTCAISARKAHMREAANTKISSRSAPCENKPSAQATV